MPTNSKIKSFNRTPKLLRFHYFKDNKNILSCQTLKNHKKVKDVEISPINIEIPTRDAH